MHHLTKEKLDSLKVAKAKPVKRKARCPVPVARVANIEDDSAEEAPEARNPDFFKKRRITQKDVDTAVTNVIINNRLPYRIVDSPDFRHAVLLGCPDHLTVCCRQVFAKRLTGYHDQMVENVSKELASVPHLCTTADAWSKHRRGYLGMTCTWLNPKTIQREIIALSVRRLKGRHTHKHLAAAMKKVHEKFKLKPNVIRKTITDSGANFVKAFKEYSRGAAADDANDGEYVLISPGSTFYCVPRRMCGRVCLLSMPVRRHGPLGRQNRICVFSVKPGF